MYFESMRHINFESFPQILQKKIAITHFFVFSTQNKQKTRPKLFSTQFEMKNELYFCFCGHEVLSFLKREKKNSCSNTL